MTCIVAVTDNKQVWLGGDSAGTRGTDRVIMKNPKVWTQGPYVYGIAGNPVIMQRIRASFNPDVHSQDAYDHIAGAWVDQLRDLTVGYNLGSDVELPAEMLIGYKGRVFELCPNYLVIEAQKNYMSVGSGSVYALGSLTRTSGDPEKRIREALEAACEHDSACAPPFNIVKGASR